MICSVTGAVPTPVATAPAADAGAAVDAATEAAAGADADDATGETAEADAEVDGAADAGGELPADLDELLQAETVAMITTVDAARRSEVRGRRARGDESCAVERVFGTVTPWVRSVVRW
jgi:hypothetical protein